MREALKEDGVSYHYHGEDDSFVRSNWFDAWAPHAAAQGFHEGVIWTCDAIYRETVAKIARFRDMGVSAVEMETASFYSVSRYRDVKGVAFLVVSDLLSGDKWVGGFRTKPFKDYWARTWRWQVISNQARVLLVDLLPYLIIKKEEAEIVINFPKMEKRRFDEAIYQKQVECLQTIREINRRVKVKH